MKIKNIIFVMALSVISSFASIYMYGAFINRSSTGIPGTTNMPVHVARFNGDGNAAGPVDFTGAATAAAPAVVHIQTHISAKQVSAKQQPEDDDDNPFSQLFGNQPRTIPEQRGSGSGVILSDDGYIVTNNHVIDGADNITVTLANHKTYKAVLVGADPKKDLAVLKIAVAHLPFLLYGNSDNIEVGQWVLAVGYPWNLDITVTAGIISAKTRTVGIDKPDHPVETYIQTDAAINLGNSGGALINTKGELIGINAALASPTGSYAGYSYAIPVNIVKQTVETLIRNSTVKGNRS